MAHEVHNYDVFGNQHIQVICVFTALCTQKFDLQENYRTHPPELGLCLRDLIWDGHVFPQNACMNSDRSTRQSHAGTADISTSNQLPPFGFSHNDRDKHYEHVNAPAKT